MSSDHAELSSSGSFTTNGKMPVSLLLASSHHEHFCLTSHFSTSSLSAQLTGSLASQIQCSSLLFAQKPAQLLQHSKATTKHESAPTQRCALSNTAPICQNGSALTSESFLLPSLQTKRMSFEVSLLDNKFSYTLRAVFSSIHGL